MAVATDGSTDDIAVARFTANGTFDLSFGTNGIKKTDLGQNEYVGSVALQDDGKILVLGRIYYGFTEDDDLFICRFLTNGNTDVSFGTNDHAVKDLNNNSSDMPGTILYLNNKIVASGLAHNGNASEYDAVVLLRYQLDDTPGPSFGIGGVSIYDGLTIDNGIIYPGGRMASDQENRLVVVTHIHGIAGDDFAVLRFLPNGYPDNSFGDFGMVVTDMIDDNAASAVTIQTDEKIIAAGYAYNSDDNSDFATVRYYSGISTGLEKFPSNELSITIYPNPVHGRTLNLRIESSDNQKVTLKLVNLNGEVFHNFPDATLLKESQHLTLPIPSSLPSGEYLVHFETHQGIISRPLVIL